MNLMPIADQGKHKEYGRNQKEPRCFGGIERMTVIPVCVVLLRFGGHGLIVALKVIRCSFPDMVPGPRGSLW